MDKKAYRKHYIAQRKSMDKATHNMLNALLMEGLRNVLKEHTLEKIGVFNPIMNEVDVRALGDTYTLYYPKIVQDRIEFFKDSGEFREGMLGVKEPKGSEALDKNDLDAIIVPGLAYDLGLYRLGYGKGYYDQLLSDYKGLKIGVAFESFLLEALPNKAHDIPVDILVTDNQVYINEHNEV